MSSRSKMIICPKGHSYLPFSTELNGMQSTQCYQTKGKFSFLPVQLEKHLIKNNHLVLLECNPLGSVTQTLFSPHPQLCSTCFSVEPRRKSHTLTKMFVTSWKNFYESRKSLIWDLPQIHVKINTCSRC
uniref:Uncharacterized protein n=1 Tax=Romanomermis culicivorax TaxID=13658 RepID=A0A915L295_ROMCU